MGNRIGLGVLAFLLAVAGAAQAAGTVKIRFVDPDKFADIGYGNVDRQRNLDILSAHIKGWEARLPDGQELDIEVLDIDLAGEIKPWSRFRDARILTGRTDAPRINLRWTLRSTGQTLKSGEERLSDLGYLHTGAGLRSNEALAYDRRMLDNWLRERIVTKPRKAR